MPTISRSRASPPASKVIPSHNNLLGRFDGADGMKTGYTCPAGFNLVASATRNGRTLMAIVIGADIRQVARRGGGRPAGERLFAADRRRAAARRR